jgi:rare lipoprotein A
MKKTYSPLSLLWVCTVLFLTSCSTKKFEEPDVSGFSPDDGSVNFLEMRSEADYVKLGKKPHWLISKGDGVYKLGKPYKVNGIWYFPKEDYKYDEVGMASWYGPGFHMKQTANGELFDQEMISAAHKTLPLPSVVKVTNLENGRCLLVRVNDRGPFVNDRILDLSRKAAELLGMIANGTARVRVELMSQESTTVASLAQNKLQLTGKTEVAAAQSGTVIMTDEQGKEPMVARGFIATNQETLSLAQRASSLAEPGMMDITQEIKHDQPKAAPASLEEELKGVHSISSGTIYVQAGAFGNKANAQKLAQKLSSIGNASLSPIQVGSKTVYRVRFGPFEDTRDAQKVLTAVTQTGHSDVKILMQ